jgi:thymidylate synthase
MLKYEQDYRDLGRKVIEQGRWVYNDRTGTNCKTITNVDLVYDVGAGEVPILTTKQCFPVSSIAELLGYYRRYDNAQQFANIGVRSWFTNANETEAWLNNPNRKGEDDLGIIYGGAVEDGILRDIYDKLCNGIDDRGLIFDMWRPETFDKGCLRPCAFMHIWSLVDGVLDLRVIQRSADLALGVPFNSFSFAWLLKVTAKIAGVSAGKVTHSLVNVHLYENHIETFEELLEREPLDISPEIIIPDWVETFDDLLEERHARDYLTLTGYKDLGKMSFKLIS